MATPTIFSVNIRKPYTRPSCPGRPSIESTQHPTMIQGMMMEHSVTDAQFAIQDAIKQLQSEINSYLSLNMVSQSAMPGKSSRPALLMMDVIMFIKSITEYIQQIIDLVKAILGVIGEVQSLANNITQFIQSRLNSIATLLNEICNMSLPDLPAIPSIYGVLNFDGFAFPYGAFDFALKFDSSFAFGSCHWRKPNTDIFRNYPPTKFGLDPSGHFGPQVNTNTNPPLPNAMFATPAANQKLSDWVKAQDAATQAKPVFRPDWTPKGGFIGSLPSPAAIITPYSLPAEQFHSQVIALLGGPILDLNPVGTTGEETITIPAIDAVRTIDYWKQLFQPAVRTFSTRFLNLEGIVDSKAHPDVNDGTVDTTVDWKLVWAWLTYVHQCREGRGGTWIQAFEDVYQSFVLPAYQEIAGKDVPWHSDPDDPSVITQGFPDTLYFVKTLTGMTASDQKTMLWKLSYIEASMLGYPRSTRWDTGKVSGYVDGPTRNDLDYQSLAMGASTAPASFFLDSSGLANYPSSILDVPEAAKGVVETVIGIAYNAICKVAPKFTAALASNRYVYTQFAETVEINSHSQFWKEFRTNWESLLLQNQELQAICFNYPLILDSAINPLTDYQGLFQKVKDDYQNRTPKWAPGTPYLPTPYITTVTLTGTSSVFVIQDKVPTGWGDLADASKDHNMSLGNGADITQPFDPDVYAKRPDVQALPPNYQSTAIYLNQAYSDLLSHKDKMLKALDQQQAAAYTAGDVGISSVEALIGGFTEAGVEFTGSIDKVLDDLSSTINGILNPPPPADPIPGVTYFWAALKTVTQTALTGEMAQPAAATIPGGAAPDPAIPGSGGGGGGTVSSIQDPDLVTFFQKLMLDITESQRISKTYLETRYSPTPEAKKSLAQSLVDIGSAKADNHTRRVTIRDSRKALGSKPKSLLS